MQRNKLAMAGLIVSCASLSQNARAEDPIFVQAVLDPNVHVVEAVKRDCALDTMGGDWVL